MQRRLRQPRSDALVTLTVPPGAHSVFVGDLAAEVVEPGLIDLWLGSSSDPGRAGAEGVRGSVRVTGFSTPLPLCRSSQAREVRRPAALFT